MSETWNEVIGFWFGELGEDGMASKETTSRWFRKSPDFDAELRKRFGSLHAEFLKGRHSDWFENSRGLLAAVIILDQFSRNMFRGTAEMFAADEQARELTRKALARGDDDSLPTAMRAFLYMPLMHSEDLADQERCVALFAQRAQESEGAAHEAYVSNHEYAVKHRDIVVRFGRFPHRNETLGRETTPEEAEFLAGPGSSF